MKILVILLWVLPSLYLCSGGISNILISKRFEEARMLPENPRIGEDGNSYRNKADQEASADYASMIKFYPMYKHMGATLSYLIFLMAFGVLGSIIRILMNKLNANASLPAESLIPVVGIIIGIVVIVVDEFLPEFKFQSGKEKFYFTMALLGGLYSKEFLESVGKKFLARMNNGSNPPPASPTP